MRRQWFRRAATTLSASRSHAPSVFLHLTCGLAAAVTLATTGIRSRRASYAGHKRSAAIVEVHARESIRIAGDKRIPRGDRERAATR